jgi:hypothetical protein
MLDEIEALEAEALAAGTWILVPGHLLNLKNNERGWLLHHRYVPAVIKRLPEDFAHIVTVLNALLETGIHPDHDYNFVNNAWLVVGPMPHADEPLRIDEELATFLATAMMGTLAIAVLKSAGLDRIGYVPLGGVLDIR